jgi:uncharacterized PurR-regulated membrane protein YhhQ (DUF165 family)
MLILLYLVAIVAANLIIAHFGASATIIVAFVFIGLDLTIRDRLHDKWGAHLKRNMVLLIIAGAVLSFALNHQALSIAIASCIAFGLSEATKAIGYHWLRKRPYMTRVNIANIAAATVDSVLFPTIAFGAFIPLVIIGQLVAKVFGGYVWTLILRRKNGESQ